MSTIPSSIVLCISGEEIYSKRVVKAFTMPVHNMTLYADFIVIPMVAFDVILSMYWLTKYRAVFDCQNKTVWFIT